MITRRWNSRFLEGEFSTFVGGGVLGIWGVEFVEIGGWNSRLLGRVEFAVLRWNS